MAGETSQGRGGIGPEFVEFNIDATANRENIIGAGAGEREII